MSSGLYQRFSATVLVVPANLAYFIDSGSSGAAAGSAYAAVKSAFPDLLNGTSDQKWDGTSSGSTWGYSTTATTLAAGNPQDWTSSYVGADFNKPITYHLTLSAGTYNIVGVQAPRAGLTTNVYSKVKAAGKESTKTAVSTGAATPVAQTITLDADGVVDLEFGTNGTSGYNARLALVSVQTLPRDLGVQGALGLTEDLPDTVAIGGTATPVVWDAASAAQPRTEYGKLTVTGRLQASDKPVVAGYEIIPAGLVYYVDSGTGGVDSPQYSAVKKTVPTLRNDKVDQVSTSASQWGYVADGMKVKDRDRHQRQVLDRAVSGHDEARLPAAAGGRHVHPDRRVHRMVGTQPDDVPDRLGRRDRAREGQRSALRIEHACLGRAHLHADGSGDGRLRRDERGCGQ